jgi:NAD(P)-dependent dehydrogenase (short-subunit alcohol dehydrogenase family)
MTDTKTQTTLVLGGTGKTGRRVAQRLSALGRPVRVGSRSGRPPFDWEDRATWASALDGAGTAYVSYYPDLAAPGAVEAVGAFARLAVSSGVPAEAVELLTYLFSEVLDGRNARVADGVRRALGREPRDFALYARDAGASGAWDVPAASGADR